MSTFKKIPPNRTVALLTPLVFAPLAGALSVAAAKYAPGVTIDQGSLEAIFIAGATIAFGNAGLWTKGWQAQEQRDAGAPVDMPAGADLDDDFDDDLIEDGLLDDGLEPDDEPELDFGDDQDDELLALLSAPEE